MNMTSKNTIFVTAAAWQDWQVKTDVIRRSAEKRGIDLILFDAGKPWYNYYENKIVHLRKWLLDYSRHRPEIEYMVFADARDAVFVKERDEILALCRQFDDERVWFNADKPMYPWPVQAAWFASRIALKYGAAGIANSGVYAGRIDRILELWNRCIDIHCFFSGNESKPGSIEQLIKEAINDTPGSRFRMSRCSGAEACLGSDQFHVQVLQAKWDDIVAVDTNRTAFAAFSDDWPTLSNRQCSGLMPLGTAGILHSPWLFPRTKMHEPNNADGWRQWAVREKIID